MCKEGVGEGLVLIELSLCRRRVGIVVRERERAIEMARAVARHRRRHHPGHLGRRVVGLVSSSSFGVVIRARTRTRARHRQRERRQREHVIVERERERSRRHVVKSARARACRRFGIVVSGRHGGS